MLLQDGIQLEVKCSNKLEILLVLSGVTIDVSGNPAGAKVFPKLVDVSLIQSRHLAKVNILRTPTLDLRILQNHCQSSSRYLEYSEP